MQRRAFCGLVLGGLALRPAPARPAPGGFASWADAYLRRGQVIDWQQNGISHSEGQGWALLLAQAATPRPARQ